MKNSKFIITIAAIAFVFSSCRKQYYVPTTQNVPMIDEKQEVVVSGGFSYVGSLLNTGGYNLQAAYGLTDNLAVKFDAHSYHSIYQDEIQQKKTDFLYEGSIGYYKKLPHGFMFDIYGGYGYAKDFQEVTDVTWHRFSIQPTLAYKTDWFDIGLTPKFSFVNFNMRDFSTYEPNYREDNHLEDIEHNIYSFIEPALTIRTGYKYGKLFFQYSGAEKLSKKPIRYLDRQVSLGLTYNFKHSFRKSKSKNTIPLN